MEAERRRRAGKATATRGHRRANAADSTKFLGEAEVYEALRDAIYDSFAVPESPNSSLQPEIIDLAALS